MVVDGRRQVGHLGRRTAGLGLAFGVVKAHQRILVGHVQGVAHQGQPVRGIELVGKHRLQLIHAVTIGIPQQGQAVAALHLRIALGLDLAGNHILRLEVGRAAAPTFGHQDIAVGQHQGLARNGQVGGDRRDLETGRHGGHGIAPGRRLGNGHVRHHAAMRLGQFGVGAELLQLRGLATASDQGHGEYGKCEYLRGAVHRTPPTRTRTLEKPSQVAINASTVTITDHSSAAGMIAQASRAWCSELMKPTIQVTASTMT